MVNASKVKSKNVYCKISSRDEMITHISFFFSSRYEISSVFLTEMSSSQRRCVNSKKHFSINRDDFIQSFADAIHLSKKVLHRLNQILKFVWTLLTTMIYVTCESSIRLKLDALMNESFIKEVIRCIP